MCGDWGGSHTSRMVKNVYQDLVGSQKRGREQIHNLLSVYPGSKGATSGKGITTSS